MKKKRIRKGQVITMKRMIKGMVLVALALTVVLGLESRVDAAGRTVRISKKNFPGKAVRVELKRRWDEDSDGKLSSSEIKKVKYLYIFASEDEKKTSLKGMQYFYNLKSVYLSAQTMNHIDLRKNKKLESLEISGKKLSGLKFYGKNLKTVDISVEQYKGDLNLRNLPKLEKVSISSDGKYDKIDLSGSKVQSIDIGDHWTSVKYLDFSNCKRLQYATVQLRNLGKMKMKGSNGLRSLDLETYYPEDSTIRKVDVSRMRDLVFLNLSGSKISQLSVKNNKKLEVLNVHGTNLKKLNLSVNKKLQTLDVGSTKIKKLDLSANKKIRELDVSHTKIRTLNLSANKKIREFRCGNNRITKMFSLPNPERVELLDISNTKMKSPNLKRYTALKELYANGISATSLDLKKCRKLEYIYLNDTKYLKRLDLSKQKLLINVEFRRSNVEELDIRATTRVCDQDEGGRGIGFDDCKKLRKVIHNKNWRYLYWFQNSAEAEGLNVMWISV